MSVILTSSSSLFPGEKAILPAALVICSTKYGEEYEFHGVVPLNILQVHRPTKAL